MSPMSHMKYMLLGGAGIFVLGLLAGVPLTSAFYVAVLLACPLMMVFMMGGHGGHDHDRGEDRPREREWRDPTPRSR